MFPLIRSLRRIFNFSILYFHSVNPSTWYHNDVPEDWKREIVNLLIEKFYKSDPKTFNLKKNIESENYQVKFSLFHTFLFTALSSAGNRFYPTNSIANNNNNIELENLYKYYKSTGQVN